MADPLDLTYYVQKILKTSVYDVAIRTPLDHSHLLSTRLGNTIYLKREDLQPVFSFKLRGAYQKLSSMHADEIANGVIAASAGNHAQGVALAAQKMGICSWIVMPVTTPSIKVDNVRRLGGEPILYGDTYDDACEYALRLSKEKDVPFIHPYDDPDVIAGQGTIGMEVYNQCPKPLDYIFVPVGGGGLLAGICAYLKFVDPSVKIIGVESEDSACLAAALKAKERVILSQVGIFVDGVAVKQIGKEPFRIIEPLIDDLILVQTDEVCSAVKDIFETTRTIAEPAGALATAGMKAYIEKHQLTHQNIVSLVCGANMNFDRLRYISERTEIGEHRECLLGIHLAESPGSFTDFCQLLGNRSITDFNYRFSSKEAAVVFVGVLLNDNETSEDLVRMIGNHHYNNHPLLVQDLSQNEMAKLHIRYMVGGRSAKQSNEYLFRIQFPERPGAFLDFLMLFGTQPNISLFHYRNHGSAFGRVLVGFRPDGFDEIAIEKRLHENGYVFTNETHNIAYSLFL